MTQTRNSRGLSLEKVAAAVGTDQTNLSRVERGAQIPRRELARALFEFYCGVIPLAAIYDPEYDPVEALRLKAQREREEAKAAKRAAKAKRKAA